jgi:hypothetical protein
MQKEKNYLTICRKWTDPKIHHRLSEDGIEISIAFDDFLTAVKQEIGSVKWIFTKTAFNVVFDQAIQRVLAGIKAESKKVI